MTEQRIREKLHALYSANFNDGEPVGERYGSKDMVSISGVIDFIDDYLVSFIAQYGDTREREGRKAALEGVKSCFRDLQDAEEAVYIETNYTDYMLAELKEEVNG